MNTTVPGLMGAARLLLDTGAIGDYNLADEDLVSQETWNRKLADVLTWTASSTEVPMAPVTLRHQPDDQPVAGAPGYDALEELVADIRVKLETLTPDELCIYLDNKINWEEEPEDEILVADGVLQMVLDQALREPSTTDWERDFDDL